VIADLEGAEGGQGIGHRWKTDETQIGCRDEGEGIRAIATLREVAREFHFLWEKKFV
jgi:hypothetical protein